MYPIYVLASFDAYGGGSIGNLFAQWEAAGVFTYALPFLLIFAMIYSILSFVKVFQNNKAVNAIISLAVALMALQFNLVSVFFADIFPRLGVALSIVLILLILGTSFLDWENKGMKWFLFLVIAIAVIVVVWGPLKDIGLFGWGMPVWFGGNVGNIIGAAVIIGLIIWVVAGKSNKGNSEKRNYPFEHPYGYR
jgi:hypothetical protein